MCLFKKAISQVQVCITFSIFASSSQTVIYERRTFYTFGCMKNSFLPFFRFFVCTYRKIIDIFIGFPIKSTLDRLLAFSFACPVFSWRVNRKYIDRFQVVLPWIVLLTTDKVINLKDYCVKGQKTGKMLSEKKRHKVLTHIS